MIWVMGQKSRQKLERKDAQSPCCLTMALLYHYLAFPFSEKGNSFQQRVFIRYAFNAKTITCLLKVFYV